LNYDEMIAAGNWPGALYAWPLPPRVRESVIEGIAAFSTERSVPLGALTVIPNANVVGAGERLFYLAPPEGDRALGVNLVLGTDGGGQADAWPINYNPTSCRLAADVNCTCDDDDDDADDCPSCDYDSTYCLHHRSYH
jgi:hypothetical protein